MSETAARWITTTPEARLTSGPGKVSVRDSLLPGTRLLDEFEVLSVLGTGGFGVVYLAHDHVLQRDIAIKEYLPALLARRGDGVSVEMRASTSACAETFEKGLASFLAEARLLASFDHPALVKVHRFWRGNGTAYMAMPYYPGQTLKDVRLQMLATPRETWLHGMIGPLLGALELLHAHDVLHRDVAPDNILVLPDGRPVLLDFGCARRAVAAGAQWFTAHLKPQFAPLEQYAADDESVGQGPWTDLYALGATLYFVVTGRAPVPSVVRAARDTLPALAAAAAPGTPTAVAELSPRLLATIDWCLALAPDDRPRDVATVRRALLGEIAPPPPSLRFTVPAPANVPVSANVPVPATADAPPAAFVGAPPKGELVPSAPVRPRRSMRPGAALLLAVAGLATVGWGAFSVQGDARAPSSVLPREVLVLPEAIEAQPPARSARAAPASAATTPVVERLSAGPVEKPADAAAVTAAARSDKPARAQKRAAPRTARNAAAAERGVCSADDASFLTAALCVLNPCRDPKGRTSAACLDRQRAEQARLRRMASAG